MEELSWATGRTEVQSSKNLTTPQSYGWGTKLLRLHTPLRIPPNSPGPRSIARVPERARAISRATGLWRWPPAPRSPASPGKSRRPRRARRSVRAGHVLRSARSCSCDDVCTLPGCMRWMWWRMDIRRISAQADHEG